MVCVTIHIAHYLIIPHDQYSEGPYNYTRAKFLIHIIIKICPVKMIFPQPESILSDPQNVCISVRSYVINFPDYLNENCQNQIQFFPLYDIGK